jgi:hypothetical protein
MMIGGKDKMVEDLEKRVSLPLPMPGDPGIIYKGYLLPVNKGLAGMDAIAPEFNYPVAVIGYGGQEAAGGERVPMHIFSVSERKYFGR